jgi:hypothetical protein
MPAKKNEWSMTPATRLVSALPSKIYVAIYMALGNSSQAKRELNDLGKALVVKYFLDHLDGASFLRPDELELAEELAKVNLDLPSPEVLQESARIFKTMDDCPLSYFIENAKQLRQLPHIDKELSSTH